MLMVVLSVVGNLVNAIHSLMMADHRLILELDAVHLLMREEIEACHSRPVLVWQRLASLVGPDQEWRIVRSKCLHSMHIAAAYIHEKTLQPLLQHPWSLTQGSPLERLQELEVLEEMPTEVNAQKMWKLLKAGYSKKKLEAILTLAKHAPFSTIAVEQAHGSSATVRKYHQNMDINAHLQRSFLHQCRHLFSEEEETVREQKALQTLHTLSQAKRPQTARQAFLRDLVASARLRAPNSCLPQETMRRIMQMHGQLFQELSLEEVHSFEVEAQQISKELEADREGDIAHLFAQLRLWQARRRQEQRGDAVFDSNVVKARYSEADLQALQKRLESKEWTPAHLKEKRVEALNPPATPSPPVQAVFSHHFSGFASNVKQDPPLWIKVFCEHREALEGIIVSADPKDETLPVYRFLYATRTPGRLSFSNWKGTPKQCLSTSQS